MLACQRGRGGRGRARRGTEWGWAPSRRTPPAGSPRVAPRCRFAMSPPVRAARKPLSTRLTRRRPRNRAPARGGPSARSYPLHPLRARRLRWRPVREASSGLSSVDGLVTLSAGRPTRLRGGSRPRADLGPLSSARHAIGSCWRGRLRQRLRSDGIRGRELQVVREAVADRDFAVSLARARGHRDTRDERQRVDGLHRRPPSR